MKSSNQQALATPTQTAYSRCRPLLVSALTLLLSSVATVSTLAQNPNPTVLPINSSPHGQTYGQWVAAWWQWALGIPALNNPVLDTTGSFAGVGQSGPVWFLGASLGASVERTFNIPRGKTLFLPVSPWVFGSCVGDCDPSNPGVVCDVPTLRASADAAVTGTQLMEVSIDGLPLSQLASYRAKSPDAFSITLPAGNVPEFLGLPTPAGTYAPQVADGYWLMLAPLPPGNHTISVHVVNPSQGLDYVVTYHLQVG